jgi:hypothetical protein
MDNMIKLNKKPQINADERRLIYRVSTFMLAGHTYVRLPDARLGSYTQCT